MNKHTPRPTYRIVDQETGRELRPYQTIAHMAAFTAGKRLQVVARNIDSPALNLHTVYVAPKPADLLGVDVGAFYAAKEGQA